jgi:peptide/nickel transport system substrate-binding protein
MMVVLVLALVATASAQELDAPRGGIVQIPLATQPATFNPILPSELAAAIINWTMFSPLTAVNPWTNTLEPYLAESWEVSDDLTVWTFHLHEGVTWHDGAPLTATDVKFTFDRIRDPEEGATTHPDFARVTDVTVVDDLTVTVTLAAPDSFFAARLALGGNEIIPSHILSGFERLADAVDFNSTNPVGTGPFKMVRVEAGAFFELTANEDFFLGEPFLDGLVFRVVPDGNTRVTQLLSGQLDWVDLEAPQLPAVRNNRNVEVHTFDSLGYQLFALNFKKPLFQDPNVVKAMMHAIDRTSMLEIVSPGLGYVDDVYVPAGLSWIPRPDVTYRDYDPELALQMLAESGWTRDSAGVLRNAAGEPFAFYILVDRGDVQREQLGLIIQQYLNDIGMQVEYVLAERGGRWLEETQAETFDSRLAAFPMPNIDWAQRLYTTDGPFNSQGYSNERIDELFSQVLATADRDEQAALLVEIGQVLYDDPPNIVLLYRDRMTASSAAVGNIPPNNIKDSMPFSHLLFRR